MGKRDWQPATATVYSVEWRRGSNLPDSEVGFFHVVYSYSVGGERFTDEFTQIGREDEDFLKNDDTFEIRYNPANPRKSIYPAVQRRGILLPLLLGWAGILLLGLILTLMMKGRH